MHEEIAGEDLSSMVANKSEPSVAIIGPAKSNHVTANGAGGVFHIEFESQLVSDAILAPTWLVPTDSLDESDVLDRNAWSSGLGLGIESPTA